MSESALSALHREGQQAGAGSTSEEYTACIACVTILPGGEGIGDIGNSLRQRARKCWPTARYRVDTPPFVMQTHNAARASDPLARDREESDVLRRDHHHHALACGKKNAMT